MPKVKPGLPSVALSTKEGKETAKFLAILDHASAMPCTQHLRLLSRILGFEISNLKFAMFPHDFAINDFASSQLATSNLQPATAASPNIPCLPSPSLLSKAMLKFFALLLLPAAFASAADPPASKYV